MTTNIRTEPTSAVALACRTSAVTYANIHQAYLEASTEVRTVIDEMAAIVADESLEDDTRTSALDTLVDAIFPDLNADGLGFDLPGVKCEPIDGTNVEDVTNRMAKEEETFAQRVETLMKQKEITQIQLAEMAGVGQSAISMILTRECRPQRRTVQRFATALGVKPTDLWPGFKV